MTRIYGSSDPSQHRVFQGNTCTHEMNVLSTATVLPRTVADMNDMLMIVFVGPHKFDPRCLKEMFTIRKQKVWSFLKWLTKYNRLYIDIPLDSTIMNTYPDNGLLPQIEHRIFEDHETNASSTFAEETAGFAEHPAQLIIFDDKHGSDSSESSTLLLEKMGVSNPDGVKISGHASTASVLKKFASKKTGVPDLVLHCSSFAVSEYSNPDLVPGMYPILFPLGLGGFEIADRNPKLPFETHANALLDVPNKSFRHHQKILSNEDSHIFIHTLPFENLVLNQSQRD